MGKNRKETQHNTKKPKMDWIWTWMLLLSLSPFFLGMMLLLCAYISCVVFVLDSWWIYINISNAHSPYILQLYIYINVIREVWSSIWYFVSYKIIAWTRFGMTTHLHNRNWHLLDESVSLTETCFNREWFWLCVVNSTNIYFYHWINPKINPSTLQCIGTQILLNTQANWD